ncbi:transcription factor grauzone-like [Sabethes cyaneus]|uniref:transcription factor grauzone-like n=1 Tax=Sabethes cyaneus TaxID=53552 RepID=UPI00237D992C|nr:transcription factor grauzone-like [Sabethes cyaneus]
METVAGECRFCLDRLSDSKQSIEHPQIKQQIKAVFRFSVEPRIGYPSDICQQCSCTIADIYDYTKKVEQNQNKLYDRLGESQNFIPNPHFIAVKHEPVEQWEALVESNELSGEETEKVKTELPNAIQTETSAEESTDEEPPDKSRKVLSNEISEHLYKTKRNQTKRKSLEDCLSQEVLKQENFQIEEFFSLNCDVCGECPSDLAALKMHFRKNHHKSAYIICHCEKRLTTRRRSLLHHMAWHKNPNVFRCEFCNRCYKTKESLTVHQAKSHEIGKGGLFKCDQCTRRFMKESTLETHKLTHKKVQCMQCDAMLANKECLKAHIVNKHSAKDRRMICDTCGQEFLDKISFERHTMRHMGIEVLKKVQCQICQQWIKGERGLRLHMFSLHYEGEQTCDICQRKYPNSRTLRNHKRTVHIDGKFECDFCEKKFKQSISLKEHRATHTGEVLYSCEYCSKGTNSKSNLYVHIKKSHPVEWAEKRQKISENDNIPA